MAAAAPAPTCIDGPQKRIRMGLDIDLMSLPTSSAGPDSSRRCCLQQCKQFVPSVHWPGPQRMADAVGLGPASQRDRPCCRLLLPTGSAHVGGYGGEASNTAPGKGLGQRIIDCAPGQTCDRHPLKPRR